MRRILVGEQLNGRAAAAKHHDRSEKRVRHHSGDQFNSVEHRLDESALHRIAEAGGHCRKRGSDLVGGGQTDDDPADVGFVEDPVTCRLEDHRESERARRLRGVVRGRNQPLVHAGNPKSSQQRNAARRRQPAALGVLGQMSLDDRVTGGGYDIRKIRNDTDRPALPVGVVGNTPECAYRTLRKGIERDQRDPAAAGR